MPAIIDSYIIKNNKFTYSTFQKKKSEEITNFSKLLLVKPINLTHNVPQKL